MRRLVVRCGCHRPSVRRVLAEVAADADALYAHYRERGDDAFTALRKVEQRLGVTSNVAAELGELFAPAWVRVLRRFAPSRAHIVERVLLGATLFFLFATGAQAMAAFRLLDGSLFPWLVARARCGVSRERVDPGVSDTTSAPPAASWSANEPW